MIDFIKEQEISEYSENLAQLKENKWKYREGKNNITGKFTTTPLHTHTYRHIYAYICTSVKYCINLVSITEKFVSLFVNIFKHKTKYC